MANDEKTVLWTKRIQELRSSGQTMKEWCMQHKISYSTMGYWLRKFDVKEQEAENEFIFAKLPSEREITEHKMPAHSSIQIFILENIRIEISDSCQSELLETLLRVLKNNA